MSSKREVETFQRVEVKIEFDKNCFKNIEETAKLILKQKLDKLNILLKNLSVYCYNGTLLINDRYNTCRELEEIAQSFGFIVKQADCALKGKNYIITDELLHILSATGSSYDLSQYANKEITEEIKKIIAENLIDGNKNDNITDMIREILAKGFISTTGTQKVTSVYEDSRLIKETREDIVSDQSIIEKKVLSFVEQSKTVLEKGNEQMQNGTVKILYHRARQMGYSVKEERKGTQIQLVLVRAE